MKLNKLFIGALATLAMASCNDKMDYNEYNIYDKDYITKNFGNGSSKVALVAVGI